MGTADFPASVRQCGEGEWKLILELIFCQKLHTQGHIWTGPLCCVNTLLPTNFLSSECTSFLGH